MKQEITSADALDILRMAEEERSRLRLEELQVLADQYNELWEEKFLEMIGTPIDQGFFNKLFNGQKYCMDRNQAFNICTKKSAEYYYGYKPYLIRQLFRKAMLVELCDGPELTQWEHKMFKCLQADDIINGNECSPISELPV